MKKSFILLFVSLMAVATYASTAVINFTGKTADGNSCTLNKVLVENQTRGWSETITDVSLTLEIISAEAIDMVSANQDFVVTNNGVDGTAQVLFNMRQSGQVAVYVYDIAGRCVCHSNTEQTAGYHSLNLEFATPQMYYLHIAIPGKNFSHSFLNARVGNKNQIQYIAQTNMKKIPAHNLTVHTCNAGDEMHYTGYMIANGNEYTDVKQETIKEGVTNIVFVFETSNSKADYYIKHPWGTGADEDWSWQPMKKESANRYTYSGLWGGIGANINNTDDDEGANWFPKSSISGATSMAVGDAVTFVYNPSASSLSVEGVGSGTGTTEYYIKHPWGSGNDADWAWKKMEKVSDNEYSYKGKWGGVGANINTEPSDDGASWFTETSIENYYNAYIGDDVTFIYLPKSMRLKLNKEQTPPTPIEELPAAPTGLRVTDENDYRIEIAWNAVDGAYYYNVYRATSASGTYVSYATYRQSLSFMDTGVSTGSKYYYKVSAINGVGEGPKSAAVSGTAKSSGGSTTTLSAPTGVTATAGSSTITVNWSSVSGANKYNIYRSTSQNGTYSKIASEYGTSHIDMSVTSGTTYYYKVTAVASDGTESAKSSAASATISGGGGGSTLSAPTNVKATYMLGSHSVQVTWNEVALCDSYEIYRSTSSTSNGSKIGTATNSSGAVYVDKLTSSIDQKWYYYRVKAKSSYLSKTSDYSEVASVYIDKNPVAPCPASNLNISGSSSLTISWSVQSQSGCGTPTEKYIQFYDYSSSASNKWVDEKVTSNSYTLTSAKLKQYTNGGTTLAGCVTFYNASGKSCLHFEYNTSTKKVTILSTSCY